MVNFTNLNNITSFSFNNSLVNNSEEIIPAITNNANTVTEGYYGLWIMLVLFIILVITIYREDGGIRLDITRTIMKASGIVFIVGIVAVITGIFTSFVHVTWFLVIFVIFFLLSIFLKKRGL